MYNRIILLSLILFSICTEPGRLMTKYYLKFNTMKHIVEAPESCSLEDILRIVCRSEEISWIQLRRNEKKLLNDVNCDKDGRLRFHVLAENGKKKKRIQTSEEKIFVLANDCLTGDPLIHDLSLSQDTNSICSNGCRVSKCMKECFIYRKSYKGALNSTLLAKCLDQRLWENSPYLLKQLPGIGMVTAKALHSMGIDSFQTMAEADPRKIEMITGRKYPFGNHIKESLLSLPPKVDMKIEEAECKRQGKSKLIISLARVSPSTSHKRHYADMVVGSEEDNLILYHERIRVEEFLRYDNTKLGYSWIYASSPVLVSCPPHGRVTVKADLIFEEYVGLDVHEKYVVTKESSSVTSRASRKKNTATAYPLAKEVYVIEDEKKVDSEATPMETTVSLTPDRVPSVPSFDLLREEELVEGFTDQEPGEKQGKSSTEQSVFDHIRKKSKNFPLLLTSKSMDSSYEPLILKRRRAPHDQFALDPHILERETVILTDSDSEPPRPSPVSSDTTNFLTMRERWIHDPYTPRSIMQTLGFPTRSINTRVDATEKDHKDKGEGFHGFKSVFSFLW
ncbi:hypothetical protein Taro_053420 [Colocasia esculenta]|uniref:SEC63 domain-containing protein n=1 Tax=Colocasia esculenta TaxID=4460 RepID=A0A843XKX8_COLES|nr:hypothetical protein [Colocasia esculenta]